MWKQEARLGCDGGLSELPNWEEGDEMPRSRLPRQSAFGEAGAGFEWSCVSVELTSAYQ